MTNGGMLHDQEITRLVRVCQEADRQRPAGGPDADQAAAQDAWGALYEHFHPQVLAWGALYEHFHPQVLAAERCPATPARTSPARS